MVIEKLDFINNRVKFECENVIKRTIKGIKLAANALVTSNKLDKQLFRRRFTNMFASFAVV